MMEYVRSRTRSGVVMQMRTVVAAVVLFATVAAAAEPDEATLEPPPIGIVSGADDDVFVATGGRRARYFRVHPNGARLVVRATGPVVLSLRVRAQRPTTAIGVLRVKRSETAFSDESYELERDPSAVVDVAAGAEQNACSQEKVLHLAVPEGVHEYALGAARGAPLLLRILKTATLDQALAIAAERLVVSEGAYAEPPPPPPPPVIEIPELTVAPAQRMVTTDAEPERPSLDAFVQQSEASDERIGLVLALRGGAGLVTVNTERGDLGASSKEPFYSGALEVAFDATPWFAPFVELTGGRGERSADAGSSLVAGSAGLSFASTGDVAVRARLGASLSLGREWETNSAGAPVTVKNERVTGLAGLGVEVKAGPGRVSVEARWRQELSDSLWTVRFSPDVVSAASVLAGYRLEL